MTPHLTESSEPIRNGDRVESLCGKVIEQCQVEFCWDYSEGHLPSMSSLSCCRKCLEKAKQPAKGRHFLYGVTA